MKVVLRADASPDLGLGHLMRSLTLARVLAAQGHQVQILGHVAPQDLVARLFAPGIGYNPLSAHAATDAEAALPLLARAQPDWVVVDHYGLGADWHARVRSTGARLLVIDDLADRELSCDLLLDQNLTLDGDARYDGLLEAGCERLIGPRYALVRPEFAALRVDSLNRRDQNPDRHLLIFLGGGDVLAETLQVIDASRHAGDWTALTVVVGAGCPEPDRLRDALSGAPGAELHVQTPEMARLMSRADVAVTASGSVSWEKCTLGLTGIGLSLAPNQAAIAEALQAHGAQITTSMSGVPEVLAALSPERIRVLSLAAREICDGLGAQRVADRLEALV